jgi:hypothetical protein
MLVRLPRILLLPALLATAALGTAGCSVSVGDKTIDAKSVEDQITKNIEAQGTSVDSVSCPGDQKAAKGNTFDCTVHFADGSTRTARVELVDDKGTFSYTVSGADGAGGTDTGAGGGSGAGTETGGAGGAGSTAP